MKLFKFIKKPTKFESEISEIQGLRIKKQRNSTVIEISNKSTLENIGELLRILRKYDKAFALYDSYYPSASDPGAYINYSQEKNGTENAWSMTLGNHGWTGGIYTIYDHNIAIQIHNLIKNNQIDSIQIDNVKIFSHYDKQHAEDNMNQNALIYGIHSRKDKINADYLIFGVFVSDSYSSYNIYKLTKVALFVDRKERWHIDRHTQNGYVFEGEPLDESQFIIARDLLFEIPSELLAKKWKGFYTTGNKSENKLIIGFGENDFHKSISIDGYEMEIDKLPTDVKNFRRKIESIIVKLNK